MSGQFKTNSWYLPDENKDKMREVENYRPQSARLKETLKNREISTRHANKDYKAMRWLFQKQRSPIKTGQQNEPANHRARAIFTSCS